MAWEVRLKPPSAQHPAAVMTAITGRCDPADTPSLSFAEMALGLDQTGAAKAERLVAPAHPELPCAPGLDAAHDRSTKACREEQKCDPGDNEAQGQSLLQAELESPAASR